MKKIYLLVLLTVLFNTTKSAAQGDQFIGQIAAVGFNFAPPGWMLCQGQILPIQQYTALFSLLGTTYGGNGTTTFALPDLRGRILIGVGQGPGLTNRFAGGNAGSTDVTLTVANIPAHSHSMNANTGAGTTNVPSNALANTGVLDKEYSIAPNAFLRPTGSAGTDIPQPLNITQPYLGINYIIAVSGIYPSHP